MYMRARKIGHIRSKGLLVAIGLHQDGHRDILGFSAGGGENYDSWKQIFRGLKEGGLSRVHLVTSDSHKGLV